MSLPVAASTSSHVSFRACPQMNLHVRLILDTLPTSTVDDRFMPLPGHLREALFGLRTAMLKPVGFRQTCTLCPLPGFARLPQIDDLDHRHRVAFARPGRYRAWMAQGAFDQC